MTSPDNFFKPLTNYREDPSSRVWEGIEADQQLKRKRRSPLLWWGLSLSMLTLTGLWFIHKEESPESPILAQMVHPQAPLSTPPPTISKESESTLRASVKLKSANPENIHGENWSPKNNKAVPKNIYNNSALISAQSPNQSVNLGNEILVQDPLAVPRAVPLNDSAIVEENQGNTQKDSIAGEQKYMAQKKNRPREKAPRRKFFEAQVMMARTYRTLGPVASGLSSYRNLRNSSEIASTQPGIQIGGGLYFNNHWSLQGGLFFMPQKLLSSYTWQQMKITQVLDSTRTRNVFDSTSMQWVTKVDSFSHPVTTQQQINSNSDQSFYFIKLPIWTAYEKAVKKLTYYAGLGASLNILVSTRGSIRDYQSAYGQMTLDRGITKLLGVDLMTRIGTRFPIGRSTEMSMGLRGGWSPTNVFTKNYPLSQFHFWYGIEIGVRKLLY